MILEIIIILAIAGILVILLRKLPALSKFNYLNIQSEANKSSQDVDKNSSSKSKNAKNKSNFLFFKKVASQDDLYAKANKLFSQKKYKEAEKIFIRLVTNDPQNVKLYNRLGVIYMEEKNFEDAKNAFYEALKLNPQKASRHYNYAMACGELDELRNAIESLEQAIKLDKKNKKYKKSLEDLRKKIRYCYKEMKRTED